MIGLSEAAEPLAHPVPVSRLQIDPRDALVWQRVDRGPLLRRERRFEVDEPQCRERNGAYHVVRRRRIRCCTRPEKYTCAVCLMLDSMNGAVVPDAIAQAIGECARETIV